MERCYNRGALGAITRELGRRRPSLQSPRNELMAVRAVHFRPTIFRRTRRTISNVRDHSLSAMLGSVSDGYERIARRDHDADSERRFAS